MPEHNETKGAFPTKFLQNFPFHLISKISLNFMILDLLTTLYIYVAMDVGTGPNFV